MTNMINELPDFPVCPVPHNFPYPPEEYKGWRDEGPVKKVKLWDGSECWVVTRYDEVRQILAHKNLSSDVTKAGYPFLSENRAARLKNYKKTPYFLHMDPPEHSHHRRMLTKEFMLKAVNEWRPYIEEKVDELIDDMLAGPNQCDLVKDFALPLPTAVITKMLGVPYEDHEFFHRTTVYHVLTDVPPEDVVKASNDMGEYLRKLIRDKVDNPGDDMFSRLVHDQLIPGHIDEDDLTEMARLLLIAGHETTANMIGLGMLTFMQHPDQMAELKANPDLIPSAIEELLRYHSILHLSSARVATGDIEIGGVTIKEGDGIVVLLSSANHDQCKYANPENFDIHRNPRDHIAFSFGPHQCLGQPFARLEMDIVFRKLLERIPDMRLACSPDELQVKEYIIGLISLPVTWGEE